MSERIRRDARRGRRGTGLLAARRWTAPSSAVASARRKRRKPNARISPKVTKMGSRPVAARSTRSSRSCARASAQLDVVMRSLARPFEELDKEVEEQLTLLALTVGKQMVRRELKTDPAQVIGVIRECVGRLPAAARDVRVKAASAGCGRRARAARDDSPAPNAPGTSWKTRRSRAGDASSSRSLRRSTRVSMRA